jgi:hypothetical protein
LVELGPGQSEALVRARLEVLDEHVAHRQQLVQEAPTVGMGEVELDAALAASLAQWAQRDVVLATRPVVDAVVWAHIGRVAPRHVAAGRLYADHLGPERRQVPAADGTGHDPTEVDDPHPVERARHVSSLSRRR